MRPRFDRSELGGALGDLGTFLPLSLGLILVCGMDAAALLICAGLFYALAGLYFRIPTPVQPMKTIGAYAIAEAIAPAQIHAAGLWMAAILLVLAGTGAITLAGKLVPKPVVRGVQLSTGILLMAKGVDFILGTSAIQQARGATEPFLAVQSIGPLPIGILLGVAAAAAVLMLLENRIAPAALVVVLAGASIGTALGGYRELAGFSLGLHLPQPLPHGLPDAGLLVIALTALALPQLPMTLGNATIAQADLAREYFGDRARRMTLRGLATSMGLANLASALLGGMPMCHGAGGLAAHYRFGARTAGANLMIGGALVAFGVLAGDRAVSVMTLLPFAVLGALLLFAGAQLALMVRDVTGRRDLFVSLMILGIALATNLAWGFGVGIALAYAFRFTKMKI